ncbi:MAG TPA: shikimate kinase [Vicinamibacteria bacterium]|nr:shikimate kinase [Vicinamibacteria bacterium]
MNADRPSRVVLVGFMGAGKSTVGPLVAQRLGWAFLDLDDDIEAAAGRAVPEIFATDGEAAFRAVERAAADRAGRRERLVLATGGGAFTVPETRRVLQRGALTVWLRCALDALLARIPADGSRPLAANRATIGPLLAGREPSYALADLTVDTTHTAPADVARIIAEAATTRGRKEGGGTTEG